MFSSRSQKKTRKGIDSHLVFFFKRKSFLYINLGSHAAWHVMHLNIAYYRHLSRRYSRLSMLTEFVGFEMNFERNVFLSTDENKLDRKKKQQMQYTVEFMFRTKYVNN